MTFAGYVYKKRVEYGRALGFGESLKDLCKGRKLDHGSMAEIEAGLAYPYATEVSMLGNAFDFDDAEVLLLGELYNVEVNTKIQDRKPVTYVPLHVHSFETDDIVDSDWPHIYDDSLGPLDKPFPIQIEAVHPDLRGSKADKEGLSFGQFVKQKRMSLGYTLREFCEAKEVNPVSMSEIERGIAYPYRIECLTDVLEVYGYQATPFRELLNDEIRKKSRASIEIKYVDMFLFVGLPQGKVIEGWQQDLKDSYQMGFDKDVAYGNGELEY